MREHDNSAIKKEIQKGLCHPDIKAPGAYIDAARRGLAQVRNFIQQRLAATKPLSSWGMTEIEQLHFLYFSPLYRHAGQIRGPGNLATFGGRIAADPEFIRAELDLLTRQKDELLRRIEDAGPDSPHSLAMRLELIAFFHGRLVFIHPFTDGNGRLARLLADVMDEVLLGPLVDDRADQESYMKGMRALPKDLGPLCSYFAGLRGWDLNLKEVWQPPFPVQVTLRGV